MQNRAEEEKPIALPRPESSFGSGLLVAPKPTPTLLLVKLTLELYFGLGPSEETNFLHSTDCVLTPVPGENTLLPGWSCCI
jgi:hypothetical protein